MCFQISKCLVSYKWLEFGLADILHVLLLYPVADLGFSKGGLQCALD